MPIPAHVLDQIAPGSDTHSLAEFWRTFDEGGHGPCVSMSGPRLVRSSTDVLWPQVDGTVAITDHGWYEYLLAQGGLDEVNFWTPSAHAAAPGSWYTRPFLSVR